MQSSPVLFNMPVQMYKKSCCTIPRVGIGVGGTGFGVGSSGGGSKMLKFYIKIFYVMGEALSDELSCMEKYLFNRVCVELAQ